MAINREFDGRTPIGGAERTFSSGVEGAPPPVQRIVSLPQDGAVRGRQEREGFSFTTVTVADAQNKTLFRGKMAPIQWQEPQHTAAVHTTHPEIMASVFAEGPAAFDKLDTDGVLQVTSADSHVLRSFWYDSDRQLVTVARGVVFFREKMAEEDVAPIELPSPPKGSSNSPIEMSSAVEFEFKESPLYRKNPRIQQSFATLGFDMDEARRIFPTPKSFAATLDQLREADTSGLYYPEVSLLPVSQIDAKPYLESYAAGKHPVGTHGFYHYTHDTSSDHAGTLMTFGKNMMDLIQGYSQVILERRGDTVTFADTEPIDMFTGLAGLEDLDDINNIVPHRIVRALEDADRLKSTKIAQWMHAKGMIHRWDELTPEVLSQGLRAEAKARLHDYNNGRR